MGEYGCGAVLSFFDALVGWAFGYVVFDGVEFGDVFEDVVSSSGVD